MKRRLIVFITSIMLCAVTYGQGILRGKITDENGESLIGATVAIKGQTLIGTITDFNGNYSIKAPSSGPQFLSISYVGYQGIEDTITLDKSGVTITDFIMIPLSNELEDVVVVGKSKKEKDKYMQMIKVKSPVSIDYISAETIKRTGDSNAGDAIKRITGVSTIGGFISVRGLADRYIKTSVNGMRIPTLDPITNNIKLDIFPTSLVDNIVITKTANPDLPGDWAGSFVSVETKDYPDKLLVMISTTFHFNPQTSFQETISSLRSPTDWLGYDNGFREAKPLLGYSGTYPQFLGPTSSSSEQLTPYKEFAALGLGNYFNEMGFSEKNLDIDSKINRNIYYKLSLVELGLLAPGLIDNDEAVTNAMAQYDAQYKETAFKKVNEPVVDFSRNLPANWGTITRNPKLSGISQEVTIGNQLQLFKRPLGFIFGARYANSTRFDPNSLSNYTSAPEDNSNDYILATTNNKISSESTGWSTLLNLAYSFSPNHSVSAMFMPNLGGINYARQGKSENYQSGVDDTILYNTSQYYEERQQLIYQFHSIHFFPTLKLKLNFGASYTDGSSSIPDSKSINFYPAGNQFAYSSIDYNQKRSSYLDENVLDLKLAAELPLGDNPGLIRKLKFGTAYQASSRDAEIYQFTLSGYPNEGDFMINNFSEINDVFTKDRYDINNESFLYYFNNYSEINFVLGESKVTAGYLMLDYAINSAFRFSGGLRLEYTDIFTDVQLYHELGLPDNHPMREGATAGLFQLPASRPGELKRYSYLPSANLVYKLRSDENVTINSRLSFSQSIARPSIRELTPLYQEDFILKKEILGNPKLKMVEIDNYDLRMESFFSSGDNVSLTFFYKKFRNHIEMVEVPYTTWRNAEIAEAYGFEIEGQKILFKNFDIKANITLIQSFSRIELETYTLTHPMFGQAPYIVNFILGYSSVENGLSAGLSFNVQGQKLALVSVRSTSTEVSDIYEMPQQLLDFKVSKNLGKNFSMSIKIRNILNSPIRRSYIYKTAGEIDYDRYTYGTDYSIGISYNL